MAANRQGEKDRRKWNKDHEQSTERLLELLEQVDTLEAALDKLLKEE
jgi:hypothetical protein